MLTICYLVVALSTISTTVCLLSVTIRFSRCFEVLEVIE